MTRAEKRVLAILADGEWHEETELQSSFSFLQGMYLRGLLDGAMKTYGNVPSDRVWKAIKPSYDAARHADYHAGS